MTPSVAVVVAHAAHREARRESCWRLLDSLTPCPPWASVIIDSTEASGPHSWTVWSEAQWRQGVRSGADYVVCMNDDVVATTGFWRALEAIIACRPEHMVALYNGLPAPLAKVAQRAHADGLRWVTSCDGLLGQAYMMPREALERFLVWRDVALIDGAVNALTEDQLVNLYCMSRGALIWHAVPALVTHDTTVASEYGHDENDVNAWSREASVSCVGELPADGWDTDALHVGRVFRGNHYALLAAIKAAHEPGEARGQLVREYYRCEGDRVTA